MPKITIKKEGWNCIRCGHDWVPKEGLDEENKPMTCPKCRSPYWDTPRRSEK